MSTGNTGDLLVLVPEIELGDLFAYLKSLVYCCGFADMFKSMISLFSSSSFSGCLDDSIFFENL